MDDESEEVIGSGRSVLVFDRSALPEFNLEALRSSLDRPDTAVCVVVRQGLGAYVALEFDLGSPAAA